MNILDAIINAQDGAAVKQLGSKVGLDHNETRTALAVLVPALAAGFQRNLQSDGGLNGLIAALSSGNHGQYLDNPGSLGAESAIADGNGILGHLLGSKEVSRQVATRASAQTGLSSEALKRLLPLAASLMMAAFAKHSVGAASVNAGRGGPGGGIAAMLTPLLDRNRDGSIVDDVTSMIGRFVK